ncbi:MAG TPA: nidogen-like domain-containing protein [Bacteroidia bacterium]|nr:nidogen-like domain-containing protein [Bacteroidia bacterium]
MKKLLHLFAFLLFTPVVTVAQNSACNCYHTRDTSYHVVPFTDSAPPEYRTDDWSSPAIHLPFTFCLYGQSFDSVFINMNGNITFHARNPYYRGKQMYEVSYPIIAPFWSDADNTEGGGLVYYKLTASALIIQWEDVPYYNFDSVPVRFNRYQMIITDGGDHLVTGGNLSFCFGDIQYSNGVITGGSYGVGGHPGISGISLGDSMHYSQVGSFNMLGDQYDGAFGSDDGIDFMDYKYFDFDACDPAMPTPIVRDSLCDTVLLSASEIKNYSAFSIFPNPGHGEFTIQSQQALIERIDVMDMNGKIIQELYPAYSTCEHISINSPGMYFIIIYTNTEITTHKVICE